MASKRTVQEWDEAIDTLASSAAKFPANDFGKDEERCIVQAGVGLREVPKVENWRSVRRMSLMENEIEKYLTLQNALSLQLCSSKK
ncbi:unnamed protein product [Microthlaspi erraticum]|uniref:Uncharacterized protein n=1 Tax=Microthlaspi erraticum TaxID=1685480 RepID=A0A6D2IPN4_9BRAS|nr:unnamed protein product [Microthlaspi erraticum]